ncbi:STAS domain-containing protein, partial [Paenibacillus ihuae]|uniref:STAS domain-containing protein n=1 Tax=Paenibacillus ihuae TaxID=1232431 RepID=UPI001FD80EF2
KIASIHLSVHTAADTATYTVSGQLFFGTISHFVHEFNYDGDPEQVIIDFTHSHVWDQSAAGAIAKTISRYEALGKKVEVTGLNEESTHLVNRIGLALSGGNL